MEAATSAGGTDHITVIVARLRSPAQETVAAERAAATTEVTSAPLPQTEPEWPGVPAVPAAPAEGDAPGVWRGG